MKDKICKIKSGIQKELKMQTIFNQFIRSHRMGRVKLLAAVVAFLD